MYDTLDGFRAENIEAKACHHMLLEETVLSASAHPAGSYKRAPAGCMSHDKWRTNMTPKNTICLWYDGTALDAA
jgi:hypothetical protein